MTPNNLVHENERLDELHRNGYYIIHPMGWDAFGLPAENYAIKMGVHPAKSTADNVANIKRQINEIAASYKLEGAKLKEMMGEREKEQIREDLKVQAAIDLLVEQAKLA